MKYGVGHIGTVGTLFIPGCGRVYAGEEMDGFVSILIVSGRDSRDNVFNET